MAVPFSSRSQSPSQPNALALRRAELDAQGRELVDLTSSNPTDCGLVVAPPPTPLTLPVAERYAPQAMGLEVAREAVSRWLGGFAPARQVVLSASSSEAYGWLLKLLCDAGDAVLVPRPCYPLLEELAQFEGVALQGYSLRYDGQWWCEVAEVEAAASARTRALVAVSPGNPTGATLSSKELQGLAELCARRGWALVLDEVFAAPDRAQAGAQLPCLTFCLGGLSKAAGLPQLKLGWLVVSGPKALVEEALHRLEGIADAYLSVSSPVQHAAGSLLQGSGAFREAVRERCAENRRALAALHTTAARWSLLRGEDAWSAVLRIPAQPGEEATCLAALEAGVVVHPGYFYDFPFGAHLVLSLLAEPARFREGAARLVAVLDA